MTYPDFKTFGGVPLGFQIRGTIKGNDLTTESTIFRIRRGNGFYGSENGKLYQDKYTYFVPASIYNAEGNASRAVFASAVAAWQILSSEEKKVWKIKTYRYKGKSGFNLFISDYMHANL